MTESLAYESWPLYEERWLVKEEYHIPIQINGKVRDTVVAPVGCSQKEVFAISKRSSKIQKYINGKTVERVIFIKNRIMNIVVR